MEKITGGKHWDFYLKKTDNLIINTNTLTYSDIIDTEIQESSGFGISANISATQYGKTQMQAIQIKIKAIIQMAQLLYHYKITVMKKNKSPELQ